MSVTESNGGPQTEGRVVLVAGGTARTGEAVLRRFLEHEFLVATTVRDRAKLTDTLVRLPDQGAHVQVIEVDLLEEGGAERAVAQVIDRFGRLDAVTTLVGGGFSSKPFAETSLDDLRRMVEGNLYSTYTLCRAALPHMLARGGGYVATVAGGSAFDPGYGRSLFGASKAAVVTLTKGIARDHKQQGIRANCLMAGTIATAEARRYLNEDDLRAAATLREFADALVFLCSPAASGLSGAVIELNGREID
jgi:NAD(P)-dependent dehydrogenase (short-subunit alcohol dehydrogenase family)